MQVADAGPRHLKEANSPMLFRVIPAGLQPLLDLIVGEGGVAPTHRAALGTFTLGRLDVFARVAGGLDVDAKS